MKYVSFKNGMVFFMASSFFVLQGVVVELVNNTTYNLIQGSLVWNTKCGSDTFSLDSFASQKITWTSFLGLGKTCTVRTVSFVAHKYFPEYERAFVFQDIPFTFSPPVVVSVGPKGKIDGATACKNLRITVTHKPSRVRSYYLDYMNPKEIEKEFTVEYVCYPKED